MRRHPALTLLVAAICALAAAAPAHGKSSDVIDADVALRLAGNGDLLVTETLTFDYRGTFQGSYRDIELNHGEVVTDVQVSEGGRPYQPGGNTALGSFDLPGRFGTQDFGRFVRVVWHYRATDEQKTFAISYRVRDGAVAHDDVIGVFWTVWGEQWDFDLEQLSASFTDPDLDPTDDRYRVWGHPREVEGETARNEGGATLVAENVPSETGVELRVTLPRAPERNVSGMRVEPGDGLADILAEEKALDEDFNTPYKRFRRWVAHNSIAVAFGIAALAALALTLLALFARERRVDVPKHLPEPPDDAGPALAYALAHEGGDSKNTVLATLLDLVDRAYYDSSETTTEKEKLDLEITIAEKRPPAANLERYELETLEFFDALLGKKKLALSKMADAIPQHSALWRGRWQRMTEKLDAAEENHLSWDRDLSLARAALVLVLIVAFWFVLAAVRDVEDSIPLVSGAIGVATLIGVLAFPGRRLKRIGIKHTERAARWGAFARWTKDFPKLEDDPPATLELWKRILVYGVAFGTAERMIESGRIPEPVVAESSGWTASAFHGSLSSPAFDGSSFSSGFSSQVAPEVSSGSGGGGGGFSGGGGGGGSSGGGGGGSW